MKKVYVPPVDYVTAEAFCPKDGTALVCPTCIGRRGGATASDARLEALAENRKKRWPKKLPPRRKA